MGIALAGCADTAVMPALTRVIMKGFLFVEIVKWEREYRTVYSGVWFEELRGRDVAVMGWRGSAGRAPEEIARREGDQEG